MHRINRIEIELQAGDMPSAQALSERVSQMHERRVAPILDRVCGELSDGEMLDRIDVLEVELGAIPEEDFEASFVARLESALRAALVKALRPRRGAHAEGAAQAASLELLETFALTGNLPWWADARDSKVVSRHFARAATAAEAREQLLARLRRLANDPVAVERLARAIEGEALAALAGRAREGAERAPVQMGVAERKAMLLVLAGHPPELLEAAASAIEARASEGRVDEPLLAPGARAEHSGVEARPPVAVDEPIPGEADPPLGRREPPRAADLTRLDELPPASQRPRQERDTVAEVEPGALVVAEPSSAGAQQRRSPSASRSPAVTLPAAEATLRAARRDALARMDEVYVDDAGLVILWPFLERFFVRVGLLGEDRRFLDEGAALQAVALLGALVTEEPEPLEFRLPLPKLLCGQPLESRFVLERPLTPEQLEEGGVLLTAAIDRAQVLGEMSLSSFRATFLQRRGALTTREGTWLLQVERQAHDLLLDRFPWSWGWVKLPWMPDPLRVEW